MYERILVPTDGGDGTETVIEHAVGVAAEGAAVHGLYVVDVGASRAGERDTDVAVADRHEEGDRAVDAVAEAARTAGLEAVTDVVEGDPHREIVAYADEADVDLVVMGTRGRTGRDRVVLGSVTERVVGSVGVPLLTVQIGED